MLMLVVSSTNFQVPCLLSLVPKLERFSVQFPKPKKKKKKKIYFCCKERLNGKKKNRNLKLFT